MNDLDLVVEPPEAVYEYMEELFDNGCHDEMRRVFAARRKDMLMLLYGRLTSGTHCMLGSYNGEIIEQLQLKYRLARDEGYLYLEEPI